MFNCLLQNGRINVDKLLSLRSNNKKLAFIIMFTCNRSTGKTTTLTGYTVHEFARRYDPFEQPENGKQFLYLVRRIKDAKNFHLQIQQSIQDLEEPQYQYLKHFEFQSINRNDVYSEIQCRPIVTDLEKGEKKPKWNTCGFVAALANAGAIRNKSAVFHQVQTIWLDEFMEENNNYVANEVNNLVSIITSVARGGGKSSRDDVRVLLTGNMVSVLNPYYDHFEVIDRLKPETKILRGDNWILVQEFSEKIADELKNSGVTASFAETDYFKFSTTNAYLRDDTAFIDKSNEKYNYLATVIYNKQYFAIKRLESGFYYCDRHVDPSFPSVYALDVGDHNGNTRLFSNAVYLKTSLRQAFEIGKFRFQDIKCKGFIFKLLKY